MQNAMQSADDVWLSFLVDRPNMTDSESINGTFNFAGDFDNTLSITIFNNTVEIGYGGVFQTFNVSNNRSMIIGKISGNGAPYNFELFAPAFIGDMTSFGTVSGLNITDFSLNTFRINTNLNNAIAFDELRVGTTLQDVSMVPEPITIASLTVGLFALTRKRRNKYISPNKLKALMPLTHITNETN